MLISPGGQEVASTVDLLVVYLHIRVEEVNTPKTSGIFYLSEI